MYNTGMKPKLLNKKSKARGLKSSKPKRQSKAAIRDSSGPSRPSKKGKALQPTMKARREETVKIVPKKPLPQTESPKKAAEKEFKVHYLEVDQEFAGQRIDNFLMARLKGVPRSRVYRMVRGGEVRVNKKRIGPFYRVQEKDSIRVPPVNLGAKANLSPPSESTQTLLSNRILYEDEQLLIINKPSGMSVHGGSTVRVGVIEALRAMYPKLPQLELAHRLDSDTSGCLILAKKRSALRELHALFREGGIRKIYWALTKGQWNPAESRVNAPLKKHHLKGGERIVKVDPEGKASLTVFKPLEFFNQATLVEVYLYTGRTHQIRVHAQCLDHAIAGDERYGDSDFNNLVRKQGLKRLFLHAKSIDFVLASGKHIHVDAPLDDDLKDILKKSEYL